MLVLMNVVLFGLAVGDLIFLTVLLHLYNSLVGWIINPMFYILTIFFLPLLLAQTPSPRDVYEASLKKIIANLQADCHKQTSSLSDLLTRVGQVGSSEKLMVEIQRQGLANFRQELIHSINDSAIPYNEVTWKCNSTTFDHYNSIASSNQQLLLNEKKVSTQVESLPDCPQVEQLKELVGVLQTERNALEGEFKYLCPVNETVPQQPATQPNQQWVSNLDNPTNNWIYGQVNPKDYYAQVNDLITKGAQLCPATTPYVNSANHCVSCQYIYDLSIKNCATCPQGSSYNHSIHQCDTSTGETVIKNSDPQASNYVGPHPAQVTNLTTCPSSAPFFNGSACIACVVPNYFDFTRSLCAACPKDQQFDQNQHECKPLNNTVQPTAPKFNSNIGSAQNYIGSPPAVEGGIASCPDKEPFFNGMNCISCTLPNYFNFTSNICNSCSISEIFNPTTKKCEEDPSKVYYQSSLSGVANYAGSPPNLPANNTKTVLGCPTTTPFSDGTHCLSCPSPNFFNFQTNHCELCPSQQTFDTVSKSCKQASSTTSARNSNIQKASNFQGRVPAYNSALLTCPEGASYFNGAACVTCQPPDYFDFQKAACLRCAAGLSFNVHSRQCEYDKPAFVTDTSNPNILFNGNYSQYQTETKTKQSQLGVGVCPAGSPFYDATSNRCTSCGGDTPIFNARFSRCVNCGADSEFDPLSRICIGKGRVVATLERTLMNTFHI